MRSKITGSSQVVLMVKNLPSKHAGTVQKVFSPLALIANTLPGMMLVTFFQCFIYSMGISGWVLTPVTDPVKRQAQEANLALVRLYHLVHCGDETLICIL